MSKQRRNQIFLFLAVLLLGAAAALVFLAQEQELPQTGYIRLPPQKIVSFSGFPDGTKVSANMRMGKKDYSLDISENSFVLTPEQIENFGFPYTLTASFQYPDGTYRDFSWDVDKRGVDYEIVSDGFKQQDRIRLVIDKAPASQDLPFDWSGRLEFPDGVRVYTDVTTCLEITETASKNHLNLCHSNPGEKRG